VTGPVEAEPQPAPDEPSLAPLLTAPADGLPPVTESRCALAGDVARFAAAAGPVAIDTERAGGYRYSQRAYLVQLRRRGAGTSLIDPIACPDLADLGAALGDCEWVLHAASQDLPSLADLGLAPSTVFDTEVAARLLNKPKVGLAALMESELGVRLAKEHSAADWSRRPIPSSWLNYAALDVELLLDLRDVLSDQLEAASKTDWARQEFAAIAEAVPPEPRREPWRRISGLHKVRGARRLALARALWQERDRIAAQRDGTPTRAPPDSAIVAAAVAGPLPADDLGDLPGFRGRSRRQRGRAELRHWAKVLDEAGRLPDSELPTVAPAYDGPPPARGWADRDPAAASRLAMARAALGEIAKGCDVPVENLLTPDTLRRLLWEPPQDASDSGVAARLTELGARPWQVEKATETLSTILGAAVPSLVTGE